MQRIFSSHYVFVSSASSGSFQCGLNLSENHGINPTYIGHLHYTEKCEDPLGMKDGNITDEQISVSNSIEGHDWKPRFQSKNTWCGLYENGEITVRIQFKSVVKITSVYFQNHDRITGWFHYHDARKRENIFSRKVCSQYQFCLLLKRLKYLYSSLVLSLTAQYCYT